LRHVKTPAIYVEVGIAGKIERPFLALLPSFTNRGLSCRLTWSASGDDGWNIWRCTKGPSLQSRCNRGVPRDRDFNLSSTPSIHVFPSLLWYSFHN
jgi:hypothetical protein